MIAIKKLLPKDVGRPVLYKQGTREEERGVITSWSENYIHVRYGDKINSQSTYPRDLQFESEPS